MKRVFKFTALIMTLLLLTSIFGACQNKGAESEVNSTEQNGTLSTADVSFVDSDGEATYRVIRPENANNAEASAAMLIVKQYKENHGVSLKNQIDDEEPDAAEILIGNTNREETAKAKELLLENASGRDNEYIICTINDDIVIFGMTEKALSEAASYFVNNYLSQKTVAGGINYVYQNPDVYETVTLFGDANLSKVSIVRPIYNLSYVVQLEINKVAEYLPDKTGFTVPIITDQTATHNSNGLDESAVLTKTEDKDFEIIIGNCLRDGVKTFTDKDEYEIRVEDKNIYINGGSPRATAVAVTEFLGIIKAKSSVTTADSVASGNYDDVINKYDSASYYRLTWSDDFEGTEINTDLWDVRWEEKAYSAAAGEKSTYRGSRKLKNNYVKDGMLYIEARETDDARYGGLLTTQSMMEYYMGYIEISTLHPRCEGVWTALYTMSAVSPTDTNNVWSWLHKGNDTRMYYNETDVEECYGPGNWVYQNSFAWPTQYGRDALQLPPDQTGAVHVNNNVDSDDRGFWMDFHTYGFELLDSKAITYTVDGNVSLVQPLREGAEQHAYDQPVFLRLAMAAGTKNHSISSNYDDWNYYSKYIVDYIHVYQHKGNVLYTKALKDAKWNTYVVE